MAAPQSSRPTGRRQPSGSRGGRKRSARWGTRSARNPHSYVILTATVRLSIPNAAMPSKRTRLVFILPAFSSNDASETGERYSSPNALESKSSCAASEVKRWTQPRRNALRYLMVERKREWAQVGSNHRPPACEAGALPLSYAPGRKPRRLEGMLSAAASRP